MLEACSWYPLQESWECKYFADRSYIVQTFQYFFCDGPIKLAPCIYLFMKQGSFLCFVCHDKISQTTALDVKLLVSSESSPWVGVHRLGLRLFGATVWKLLIMEPFSQWELNKIETENCIGIWGCSWWYWKSPHESDLIGIISHFSELRCKR
jgi:hypothetical protein